MGRDTKESPEAGAGPELRAGVEVARVPSAIARADEGPGRRLGGDAIRSPASHRAGPARRQSGPSLGRRALPREGRANPRGRGESTESPSAGGEG